MARMETTLIIMISLLALTASPVELPETYRKLWRDPAVNARIERNIERYRKGDATIAVVDAEGKPIPDATVKVRQTEHEFLFGCNAFVLGQLTPDEME